MEEEEIQLQAPPKPSGGIRTRVLTGVVYLVVLLVFYVLKLCVHALFFDALLLVFSVLGTYEVTRACKEKLHKVQRILIMVFSTLTVLAYPLSDFIFADLMEIGLIPGLSPVEQLGRNYATHITGGVFIAGVSVLFALLVFMHEKISLESVGYSLICFAYPSLFIVTLTVCNHLELYSELAILFVFVICIFADSLAFVFGRLFGKRFPHKLAPNVSPKKTVVGGLGGLLGGAIGAVCIFFAYYGLTFLAAMGGIRPLEGAFSLEARYIVFFIFLGVFCAAFSQFGDLVESAVKRKLGIKDMGKLLPGHGGILDRIDSSLYAGLIVSAAMVVWVMIVG